MVDEDTYFLELTRYIHLNPVKAKIANLPQNYKWSSFNGYLKPNIDKYLDYFELRNYLTMELSDYKVFVLNAIGKEDNLFNKVYAGFFLGGKEFVNGKIGEFKPKIESGDFAYKRELRLSIVIEDIIALAEKIFKEDRNNIIARKHSHSNIRKVVIYIARKITALTNKQIGDYFNISDTAVTKADNSIMALLKDDEQLKEKVTKILSAFRV